MYRQTPDLEARVYGPQRIAAIVNTLAESGIAAERTLAGSSLSPAALLAGDTRVSYRQVSTVFRNALHLTPDATLALRAGERMHLTAYGLYGYGLLSSPTHAEQADFVIKYNSTMGPVAGPVAYEPGAAGGAYVYDVFLTPDPGDELYRFALEFAFSAHMTMGRDLYGPGFRFAALHTSYPAPPHAAGYAALFDCPVRFAQARSEVLEDDAWSGFQNRMPDAVTHRMVRDLCQQFITDLTQSGGVASAVRRTLVEKMPWRFPTIEAMAQEMTLHARTLRRRLEAEGTTYRDLLAEVRRRLAIEYLRKTRMTTEEIAHRLGYSDAANFRHAFLRWTGKTPHEYRSL